MADVKDKSSGGLDQALIITALLTGIFSFACWGIWRVYHTQIATALIWPYWLFFQLIDGFTQYFAPLRDWTANVNLSAVRWADISELYDIMGRYQRWLFLPISLFFAWHIGFIVSKRDNSLKRVMGFNDLIKYQTSEWGSIGMSYNFDPSKITEGPWAPSMQPMEWIQKYAIDEKTRLIDRERVRINLLDQLGAQWTAYIDQPYYVRVIIASLACHLIHERDAGIGILDRVGISLAHTGGISKEIVAEADALMTQPKYYEPVNAIMRRHAYVATAMLSLFSKAKSESGIIASAEFRWLKGIDRTLWYALNGLGRHTTWVEAAAIKAHWEIECRAAKPINQPSIDQAVQAVHDYFAEEALK